MRIVYDGQIYSFQRAGGINRYFERIISLLPLSFEPTLLAFNGPSENWPAHPNLKIVQAPLFAPRGVARRLARPYFRARVQQLKPDLVHPTFYHTLAEKSLENYRCPVVFTVYDFIVDIFSSQLPHAHAEVARQKQAILAANAILCISNNTKKDLLERFPHLESRVTVTPLAGDLDISISYGLQKVPERPYFLFVGSRAPYKNFDGLLRAFSSVAQTVGDIALAVVGAPLDNREKSLVESLQLGAHVQEWGHLSDAHLAKMYRCSLALVYPSFYEGFGIPPLEAMSCETLVIAAATSSIPEVVGDCALLFDPRKDEQLGEILRSVARGETDRASLLSKGRRRAAEFSWARTAQQTAEVYRSLL